MTREQGVEKREQLIRDGYCHVEGVLAGDFLETLRVESDHLLDSADHPPEWRYQGSDLHVNSGENAVMRDLLEWPATWQVMDAMGLTDFTPSGIVIILSKPAGGPPLYWHQDWMAWNDPISLSPWPQTIFFSYYLVDTDFENGCFRVIPGTHRKRIPLHHQVEVAHQKTAYFADVNDPVMFGDHPDAVDLPVRAGDLVIGDARVLHTARGNNSGERRTLLLGWHNRPPTVPDYWADEVPPAIRARPADAQYETTRIPGEYLE